MDDVGARDYDDVKEGLLIEGLQDWIYVSRCIPTSDPPATLQDVQSPKRNS
jgi:hypothetical protein